MILPHQIQTFEGTQAVVRWNNQFVKTDRTFFEGLWRRTQEKDNSEKSMWRSDSDARIKILYFIDEYEVVNSTNGNSCFNLKAPYLWLFLGIPDYEADALSVQCQKILSHTWQYDPIKQVYTRGDLIFRLCIQSDPPDNLASRYFPDNYKFMEASLSSNKTKIPEYKLSNPWNVFKTGIRKPLPSGSPSIIESINDISMYLPFQVELGCGPSIEAGIPPLHTLHSLYDIADDEAKFIFCDSRFSLLFRILEYPEDFYWHSSFSYRASIEAKPSRFYRLLSDLKNIGHLVGPVITNNFDGLLSQVGLEEIFIRRYEEQSIFPNIDFDKEAKSLLVVGSHADRRKIQEKARSKGLKVIYVDPEGYSFNNKILPYPIESPQNEDLLFRMTAQTFAEVYSRHLNLELN